MKTTVKFLFTSICLVITCSSFSQVEIEGIKLDAEKVKKFTPYVSYRHSYDGQSFETWKSTNKMLYAKEMWYFSESFYVKRDHLNEGIVLNEEIIDISRFESQRKENEEAIVILPGFKDVLVLLPTSKLLYKPN